MRTRTLVLVLVGASVSIAAIARPTGTSGSEFCAEMFQACDFGWHVLQGPSPGGYDGAEAHGDCRLCFEEFPCHSSCGGFQGDDNTRAAYDAAVVAASNGEVGTVLDLMDRAKGYIELNDARRTVQVLSCDRRSVIANLSVTD